MSAESALAPLRRNPGIEEAPLEGDLMLFDPATSKFYVLNSTMAFVWRQADGAKSLEAIAGALAEEFDGVDADTARKDLDVAVGELSSLGLLLT